MKKIPIFELRTRLLSLVIAQCISITSVFACENMTSLRGESLGLIKSRAPAFGDVLIGADYDDDDKPELYIRIGASGCYTLDRKIFYGRQLAYIWVLNNEKWEETNRGNFVVIQTLRMKSHPTTNPFKEDYTFYRNANRRPLDSSMNKTAWLERTPQPSSISDEIFIPRVIQNGERDRILDISDREKFSREVPGFLRHLVVKENIIFHDRYDIWTYFSRSRIGKLLLEKLQKTGNIYTKIHTSAIQFDTRGPADNRIIREKTFEMNIDGPCHYITIDGPDERLQKQIVIQFGDAGLTCPDF
jgi:hypothetical protein